MTSIRTNVPTADRCRIDISRRTLHAAWPCLARAVLTKSRGSAEAELHLFVTLEGPDAALRGSVRVTACSGVGEPDGCTRTLLDRPVRGTISRRDGWSVVELRAEGGPSIDALVWTAGEGPADGGDSTDRCPPSSYLRTDLMSLLGLAGGRYGAPTMDLRSG